MLPDIHSEIGVQGTQSLAGARGVLRHLVFLVISNPLLKAVLQRDTETLGDLMRTSTGQQLIPVRLDASKVYLELLRSKGLLRANISIDTQMKMMTAIYMGFFLIDQVMPPGRQFSPDEMVEALVETIHRTFEPEESPKSPRTR